MKKLFIWIVSLLVMMGCSSTKKVDIVTGTLVCSSTVEGVKVSSEYAIESGVLKKYLVDLVMPYSVIGVTAAEMDKVDEKTLKDTLIVAGSKYGITDESTVQLDKTNEQVHVMTTFTKDSVKDGEIKHFFNEKYTDKKIEDLSAKLEEDKGVSCSFTD